ncbi:MAG: sigma 54-interacting transcriptional regulator [Myxococcales bacterium]|nr:sigma 54-interacting transcriptional regulator [Myxococcales bacterium]
MRVTRVTNQRDALFGRASRLRVLAGPDAGLELELPPVGVVIGADPGCDVALTDPSVSSRHCTIAPTAAGFHVVDLGSKNGTSIDGVAVGKVTAPPGAVVRVGKTLLQLLPADEMVTIPPSGRDHFGAMWGDSPAMRQVFAVLERAATSDASILFLGESGCGKELAARAIHDESPRQHGPFIVFDCGAATDTLIESDLFGHVRGSFTGAAGDRQGAFAAAHGGTLFLDEIGDLPIALQPKLLRMLEAGEVIPLGSRKPERYDVRVVAATHRDVFGEVAKGGFRGDLYYRLAVVEVHLPPLRQRREDLAKLVAIFLERAGAKHLVPSIGGPSLDRLAAYHWPGNVRELRNVITRAVALAGPVKDFGELPILLRPTVAPAAAAEPVVKADRPFHQAKDEVVDRFERAYLTDLVERAAGNLSAAARLAGLERKFLYRLLERNGLRQKAAGGDADDE